MGELRLDTQSQEGLITLAWITTAIAGRFYTVKNTHTGVSGKGKNAKVVLG